MLQTFLLICLFHVVDLLTVCRLCLCDHIMLRWIRSASVSVLRSMLRDYSLSQYLPSVLAYSTLMTTAQLTQHDVGDETACSAAGLAPADVNKCATAIRSFLHSTAARLDDSRDFYWLDRHSFAIHEYLNCHACKIGTLLERGVKNEHSSHRVYRLRAERPRKENVKFSLPKFAMQNQIVAIR